MSTRKHDTNVHYLQDSGSKYLAQNNAEKICLAKNSSRGGLGGGLKCHFLTVPAEPPVIIQFLFISHLWHILKYRSPFEVQKLNVKNKKV